MIHKLSILFYISFIFLNLAKAELNEVTKPTSWSWEGRYEISSNGEKEGNEEFNGYFGWIDIALCRENKCDFSYESVAGRILSQCMLNGKIHFLDSTRTVATLISDNEDFAHCKIRIIKNNQGIVFEKDEEAFDSICYTMCGNGTIFQWNTIYKKESL
ncbi:Uncharacterised protein [Helicobacter fennelliae]|uniref:Uncharacterized protein n=3 Tax=Helicobacter TaxID=209 RepID=A0A6D2C8D9_9HELI|nr:MULTISPECIES: hypothetical protein [Helicobacter]EMZ36975.1 hypothetical protein C826_02297 [Helicobacter bilis WiWa]TLE03074.1 hypothetical protein LS77_009305 [Helicobacter bilis]TLE03957.1 hypothetical protein LS76_009265 [Helicobacter bilis]SQC36449.1 Uncharacterised protein [Helicobacter fennelliae]